MNTLGQIVIAGLSIASIGVISCMLDPNIIDNVMNLVSKDKTLKDLHAKQA